MRRFAVLLMLGVIVADCGGGVPAAPVGSQATAQPSSGASAGIPDPSGDADSRVLDKAELRFLAQGLARPVTLANGTEDQLIKSLIDTSGLGEALGADAQAVHADLIAAERDATRAELSRLGVDPGTLTDSALAIPPGAAGTGIRLASVEVRGGGTPGAPAAPDAGAGFLAAAIAMAADLLHIENAQADSSGHVGTTLQVNTTKSYTELSLSLTAKATVDLERCPDTLGNARGNVDVWMSVSANGTASGRPVSLAAAGGLYISLKAVASESADLVEVTSRATGEMVATQSGDPVGQFTASGYGTRLPVTGSTVSPTASGGWGSGSYTGSSGTSQAILSLGNVLASRHGLAAEGHWRSGACVMLEFDPPSPKVKGSNRTLDVTVRGLSMRDSASASRGRLEVTPSVGTFAPTSGSSLPLTIRVTVPKDEQSAKAALEFRSVRGIGLRDLEVISGTPREWSGSLYQEGSLGLAELGGAKGKSILHFQLRATEDVVRPTTVDPKAPPPTVPLTLVSGDYMWAAQGTVLHQQANSGSSTSNVIALQYTDPFWPFTLPDQDFVAGEGFIDPVQMRLYVFLVAMGDRNSAGTFNLGPETNCPYFHDKESNQIFLWFDLDEEFGIADGGCWDRIPASASEGKLVMQRTTEWVVAPVTEPGEDPEP